MTKEEHYRAAERLMLKAEQVLAMGTSESTSERARAYTLLAQTHLNAIPSAPGYLSGEPFPVTA